MMGRFGVVLALAAVFGIPAAMAAPHSSPPRWHELTVSYSYEQYRSHFRSGEATPPAEELAIRRARFARNLAEIMVHNTDSTQTWKKGVNQFTDLSDEEFRATLAQPAALKAARAQASSAATEPPDSIISVNVEALPESVDWRTKGVLTPVKDQGGCGSCWAFASTESIESYAAMSVTPPNLMDLSPQQLVSCAPNPEQCGGVGGCQGSVPELAFDYVKANGMASEWSIPYTAHGGGCAGNPGSDPTCPCAYNSSAAARMKTVSLDGYVKLPANDQAAVMAALATIGPLAVNVQANTWSSYESGVFPSSKCGKPTADIDHVVQLVGYTPQAWIVRNSWTALWGDRGFIMLERGSSNATEPCMADTSPNDGVGCVKPGGPHAPAKMETVCGTCGVLYDVSYPTGVKYIKP